MADRDIPSISVDEFLDAEETAETRHSYYDGAITEMEGSSVEHAFLRVNFCGELALALRRSGRRVVGSNLMFRTGSKRMFVYPDVMVFRGPVVTMEGRPNVVTNPIFVAEVLSPSTAADDRGAKSHEYRATPSIRQYALISQDRPLIEIHTRNEDESWLLTEVMGLDSECVFSSLECSVPMAVIYEGVLDLPESN